MGDNSLLVHVTILKYCFHVLGIIYSEVRDIHIRMFAVSIMEQSLTPEDIQIVNETTFC